MVRELFDELVENNILTLLDPRCAEEVGIDDPKYCPYHQLFHHSIKDCFILKGKSEDKVDNWIISLPLTCESTDGSGHNKRKSIKENEIEASVNEELVYPTKGWICLKAGVPECEGNGHCQSSQTKSDLVARKMRRLMRSSITSRKRLRSRKRPNASIRRPTGATTIDTYHPLGVYVRRMVQGWSRKKKKSSTHAKW